MYVENTILVHLDGIIMNPRPYFIIIMEKSLPYMVRCHKSENWGAPRVVNTFYGIMRKACMLIQRHGLSHHSYADDTQLYRTMDHSNNNWKDGLARIQLCVSEIREWMNQNMLKLNDDKTELIVFTSK